MSHLVVDPRHTNENTTVIYAGTYAGGVYYSVDEGASWNSANLNGPVFSLRCRFTPQGGADFFVCILNEGLHYGSFDPTLSSPTWVDLAALHVGLAPAPTNMTNVFNWQAAAVEFCANGRVYAWLALVDKSVGLYTSVAPLAHWEAINDNKDANDPLPDPGQGFYNFVFAVTPNSPGDAKNDILLLGNRGLSRSTKAGHNWQIVPDAAQLHGDHTSYAFGIGRGGVPITYLGCDGGLGASTSFADPNIDITQPPAYLNQGDTYDPSNAGVQNYNHGLQCFSEVAFANHSDLPAFRYFANWHAGAAGGVGRVWNSVGGGGDSVHVGLSHDEQGIAVWYWSPSIGAQLIRDKGDSQSATQIQFRDRVGRKHIVVPYQAIAVQSPFLLVDGMMIAGIHVYDHVRNLNVVAVLDGNGGADAISQNFGVEIDRIVPFVAAGRPPGGQEPRLYCVSALGTVEIIGSDFRNYKLLSARPGWRQLINNGVPYQVHWDANDQQQPAGAVISAIVGAIKSNDLYVLCRYPVTVGSVTTPLLRVSGQNWIPQACDPLPPGRGNGFWRITPDPAHDDTLFVSCGSDVFVLTRTTADTWSWEKISDGLPGYQISDLWAGKIGQGGNSLVLLRALTNGRGVWERVAPPRQPEPAVAPTGSSPLPKRVLYLRHNILDTGWLTFSPDDQPNPYYPNDPQRRVFVYQSPDIKIEERSPKDYFQSDPEATRLDSVNFELLRDQGDAVKAVSAARVHLQVQSHDNSPEDNVSVWVIYSYGAPTPSLAADGKNNNFQFWQQFKPDGTIVPNLPPGGPWRAIGPRILEGPPIVLSGIAAATPRVVSWGWGVPPDFRRPLSIVAFIHSATHPINESDEYDVLSLVRSRRQIALRIIEPPYP